MDIMNNWTILKLLCVLQCLFRGNYCADNFCGLETPVVNICQENSEKETNIAYVNSGGAPKLQRIIGCECVITPVNSVPIVLNINIYNMVSNDNFKFAVNNDNLLGSATSVGDKLLLTFSKYDDTSDGGACVKIEAESDEDKFMVKCAKQTADAKGTSALSTDDEPEDDTNITLIASVVGSVVIVAFVVAVVAFIIWRRRKNRNDPDNPSTHRNSNKTKEYEDTMDDYGMKPNPAYEQYEGDNKTGADHLYDHYAVPDVEQSTDKYQSTGYEYVSCNPPTDRNTVSHQSEPSLKENTYDHTVTTSAGSRNDTENEYNHLPPSVNQNAEINNYNTLSDIKTDTSKTQTDSEYNVLKHT